MSEIAERPECCVTPRMLGNPGSNMSHCCKDECWLVNVDVKLGSNCLYKQYAGLEVLCTLGVGCTIAVINKSKTSMDVFEC